jgi:hypothetical protein
MKVDLPSYLPTSLHGVRTQRDALMMDAVCTSETSVIFNVTTRCYIPEDSKLHSSRSENLKSHNSCVVCEQCLSKPTLHCLVCIVNDQHAMIYDAILISKTMHFQWKQWKYVIQQPAQKRVPSQQNELSPTARRSGVGYCKECVTQ